MVPRDHINDIHKNLEFGVNNILRRSDHHALATYRHCTRSVFQLGDGHGQWDIHCIFRRFQNLAWLRFPMSSGTYIQEVETAILRCFAL